MRQCKIMLGLNWIDCPTNTLPPESSNEAEEAAKHGRSSRINYLNVLEYMTMQEWLDF
jgi:hypothetical protein